MWSYFGGGGGQKRRDAPKDAIVGLRSTLEMLQKRERHLENQMAEADAVARKHVTTNKTAAKAALRRKQQHAHSLEQTTAQIATLEQQIYSIEAANINQETFKAMQKAQKAMGQIHQGLSIEQIDEEMEKLREQHALGEEIAQAITTAPIGEPIDDDVLNQELEDLEQEALDTKMLKTGTVPVTDEVHRLPSVANGDLKGKAPAHHEEEDEEAELAKLQAEMAM
ncbi:MAG: ESCRT-III subunit protein snf7 [Pycnora praestabilis]|nr:MAG: ESCRT-III subunit protein snf7 [Pycnora praestabilis]